MSNSPAADWAIDEPLVRALLRAQCPDLADLPLTFFAHGWDNELYLLGDGLIVRLPRRERSAPLMATEIEWVPKIADHLSVYVPRAVFGGVPSDDFPYPWSVVPYFPGVRASEVARADRLPAAMGLADFFLTLHLPAPPGLPDNPVRGMSLDQPRFHERAAKLIAAQPDHHAELTARWQAWSTVPEWDGPDLWLHGDMHPLNLLLGSDHRLAGVIDWGDLTSGDPACDLAGAWLSFDAAGRAKFAEQALASGVYDRYAWTRAKAWALHLSMVFLQFSDNIPPLHNVGAAALADLLAEPVAPQA